MDTNTFDASRCEGQEDDGHDSSELPLLLLLDQAEDLVARDEIEEAAVPKDEDLAHSPSTSTANEARSSSSLALSNPLTDGNGTSVNHAVVSVSLDYSLVEAKAAIAAGAGASNAEHVASAKVAKEDSAATRTNEATSQVQLVTRGDDPVLRRYSIGTTKLVEHFTRSESRTEPQNVATDAAAYTTTTSPSLTIVSGTSTEHVAQNTLLDTKAAIAESSATAAAVAAAIATMGDVDDAKGGTKHDQKHTTHDKAAIARLPSFPTDAFNLQQEPEYNPHSHTESRSVVSLSSMATARAAISAFVVGNETNVDTHDTTVRRMTTLEDERERFRQQIRAGMAAELVVASPAEPKGYPDVKDATTAAQNKGATLASGRLRRSRRLTLCLSMVVLVVVVAAATASIFATSQQRLRQRQPFTLPPAASQRVNDSSSSIDEVAGPVVPAVFLPDGRQAFTQTPQLYQAVDDYDAAVATNGTAQDSLVAQQYGYPMGMWDVSRLTNFSLVFMANRLQKLTMDARLSPLRTLSIPDLSGWNVSRATTMKGMFAGAKKFTGEGLAGWDVGLVVNFSFCFFEASEFVADLSQWNTSSARTMVATFSGATSFNGDLSNWDMSAVEATTSMFNGAFNFQGGDLTRWNVSSVRDMSLMFSAAYAFNANISTWDTGNVERLVSMFQQAKAFNGVLSSWNVGKVTSFEHLFQDAFSFVGGDLSGWNTSRVTSMFYTFYGCEAFRGSVNNWDVAAVTNFAYTFRNCKVFDEDLSQWNTSNATSMNEMFAAANAFSGIGVERWNTSKVTDMYKMFKAAHPFNVDLSQWDVANVQNTAEMFATVEGYNQSLCSWRTKLPVSADVTDMFLQTDCTNARDPSLSTTTSSSAAATSTSSTTDAPLWSGPFCSVCGQD